MSIEPVKNEEKIEKKDINEQTIRVDISRLDNLMNLIGELVLGKNRLIKINEEVEERYEGESFLEELNQVVSIISLVTTDLQIAVMKTRMLPIGKTFNKFPRLIRDLSKELNKNLNLNITGDETELDKSILEEIGDPLIHIIRNACDHGIETIEERKMLNKSEEGTINLKAYYEGNNIVIEISDDGKGIDKDIVKLKALENGLILEKDLDSLSDKEIFNFIFSPGFSTVKTVSNISGRGVGMDVVKTNIEKLNGIIEIDSILNEGSTFKLKIPLTLSIIQSLLVGVQEETYAIPLTSVLETVRINKEDIFSVQNKSVIRLREEVLPLIYLKNIFDIENIFHSSDYLFIVIVGIEENKIGIVVDNLIGQEEIVIKSLGDYLQNIEGILGATIRGDGGVTLIIDVNVLIKMDKKTISISNTKTEENKIIKTNKDYNILIVDDSKTDRTIIKKSIENLGLNIIEAVDGLEALNIIKSEEYSFDVALIDIEMPKMDGYTLSLTIKKMNKYKNMQLVAVTSRTSKADRMRGVESGMQEYITKPYSPDYINGVVKKLLKLK